MDWKFQLNIVYMVKKRISNGWLKNWKLEKELQFKISKCLKEIPFKNYLTNRFLYSSSLAAKIQNLL